MADDLQIEQLTTLLTEVESKEGTDFRDLIDGNIDIIEYLNSSSNDTPLDSPVSSESCRAVASHLKAALMLHNSNSNNNNNNNNGLMLPQPIASSATVLDPHHQQQQQQQHSQQRRRVPPTTAVYGMHHPSRLPESPPETDSGPGSASSPSSASENSPYSPDYPAYIGLQGTVIHPPVGHPQNCNGVILGVQDLNPTMIMHDLLNPHLQHHHHQQQQQQQQQQQEHLLGSRVHQNVNANGHLSSSQHAVDFNGPYPPTPGTLPQVSPSTGGVRDPQTCPPSPYVLPPPHGLNSMDIFGADQPNRKRLRSDINSFVKPEPTSPTNGDDFDIDGYSHQQCIRFSTFQEDTWHTLCDVHGRELKNLEVHVVADKGFNYSHFDGYFVNQKKNHFQISVHIEAKDDMPPQYVKVDSHLKPINEFRLAFFGVKAEMPSTVIVIKQSQTDRKPVPHEPVELKITERRVTKVTVPRMHFSETTMNNQRKNGRPNPDQKYILLVINLNAITVDGQSVLVSSHASEKVIVRASNPGQFDNGEPDVQWQKSSTGSSVFHPGPVCIGTDRPQGMLTVMGDVACTGNVFHPSDQRLKEDILEMDYEAALSRLARVRIVQYSICPDVADQWGLSEKDRHKVGVIAQELQQVLPDAVKDTGEYLTVDDSRIFYDTVAAAKELCRLTGNLECKIDEVEKISHRLTRLARLKKLGSFKSTLSGISQTSVDLGGSGMCSSSGMGSCASFCTSVVSERSAPSSTGKDKDKDKDKDKLRYRHHKHCRHTCHRTDQGLCSSKVMQSTIVALVVIMAFCLIAMATLYILDWQRRNSPPDHYRNPVATKAPKSADKGPGIGHMAMTNKPPISTRWTPPLQPMVPLMAPCTVGMDCRMYCCGDQHAYEARKKSWEEGNHVDSVIALPDAATRSHQDGNYHVSPSILPPSVLLPTAHLSFLALPSVTISIPEFNITLDQRWCAGLVGCRPKEGRFHLYIPISIYMPNIPVELVFRAGNKRFVDSCGKLDDFGQFCRWKNEPLKTDEDRVFEVKKKSDELFEIPAGDFIKSAYVFRVGFTTESCTMNPAQMGVSFEEYTLHFYRSCLDSRAFD